MKNSFSMIQALMTTRGISKKQLAEIAGVAPSAVTKWAAGGAIRVKYLHKIAQHFGVDTQNLLASSIIVKQSEAREDWKKKGIGSRGETR
ncbi:MAG: helix-turn-helix domain-containing protein [Kiritimatiellaeota bacterium]|nr:helix-turn-helix domain-containing protein [Kiritimatiellota bacterium]